MYVCMYVYHVPIAFEPAFCCLWTSEHVHVGVPSSLLLLPVCYITLYGSVHACGVCLCVCVCVCVHVCVVELS